MSSSAPELYDHDASIRVAAESRALGFERVPREASKMTGELIQRRERRVRVRRQRPRPDPARRRSRRDGAWGGSMVSQRQRGRKRPRQREPAQHAPGRVSPRRRDNRVKQGGAGDQNGRQREASSRRRRRLFVVYSRIPALPPPSRSARASSSAAAGGVHSWRGGRRPNGTAVQSSALSSAAACALSLPELRPDGSAHSLTSTTASSAVVPGGRWDGGNVVGGDARSL